MKPIRSGSTNSIEGDLDSCNFQHCDTLRDNTVLRSDMMMEDRYEIRGKIGQGGLGSVYRAMDTRMNREVAVKRINQINGGDLATEARKQLSKEAKALASLQHPNIVTVYDAGTDNNGPYVVMEHISGKTLDEIISKAPLTWDDFRELALQTQEALVAAQDLELIHGDLKPGNIMLTWLPSGKFQIKIVDFGLAVFSQSQKAEDYQDLDVVYGSVYFMPPEQFRKSPLTFQSDLYSIGCVYYQALTCRYPFNGQTGEEVTQSHLNHNVIPLERLRKDIPKWVCDWVMWHIKSDAKERPASAREALKKFLQQNRKPAGEPSPESPIPATNLSTITQDSPTDQEPDRLSSPPPAYPAAEESETLSQGSSTTAAVKSHNRPKLVLPQRTDTESKATQSKQDAEGPHRENLSSQPSKTDRDGISQKNTPTSPAKTSPSASQDNLTSTTPASSVDHDAKRRESLHFRQKNQLPIPAKKGPAIGLDNPTRPPENKKITKTIRLSSPQPLLPPPGSKTSLHKIPSPPAPAPAQAPPTSLLRAQAEAKVATSRQATITTAVHATITGAQLPYQRKKGLSNATKIMIATALTILIAVFALVLKERINQSKVNETYNRLVSEAATPGITEILVNGHELNILLSAAINVGAVKHRGAIYKALLIAKSTDGTNIDKIIAEFAASREMLPDVKKKLIGEVLKMRKNPVIVPILLSYAGSTADHEAAAVSMHAIGPLADESHFGEVLVIIQGASNAYLRQEAENTAASIIRNSVNREKLAEITDIQYSTAITDEVRFAYLRLLGACGGETALNTVRHILSQSEPSQVTAAISALGSWGDENGFPILIRYLQTAKDSDNRVRAFESAKRYLSSKDDQEATSEMWQQLAKEAKSAEEQILVMNSIANLNGSWPLKVVESYLKSADEKVILRAEYTLSHMEERRIANSSND